MQTYQTVKESAISNRIVKELNAAVCTATFPGNGEHLADLYTCRNSADLLVFHNSCAPIDGEFVKTIKVII